MKNIFFSCVFLLNFFVNAAAQEIVFPLSCNPVIKQYIIKNPLQQHSGLRVMQSAVPLPFEDDFSGQGIYPEIQLWADSDAFVNQTMCDNPITIGVATLDGINKYGEPHDSNSTSVQPVICDYLTSQPIDLSAFSSASNVYLGFFYQPQGLGDEPEDGDSLVLQFYGSNGVDSNWVNVWVANGRPDSAFAEVRIKVDNSIYFWGGFQFRFYNYATPNGNRDHWNIDYVTIRQNESLVQDLNEITLVYPIQSYLRDYTSMPYSHYKSEVAAGNNPVKDTISDIIRLYYFSGTGSLYLDDTVKTSSGIPIFEQQASTLNTNQNSQETFKFVLPSQLFDTTSGDMTDFTIKHEIEGLDAGILENDANYLTQHFYNYYAYDDGSAESATGVHVAYSKYAYKFDVKKADSLLGISIYFNPWGKNVHLDLFSLCLWSSVSVGSNTDALTHQEIDRKPENIDSINGFKDYYFDTAQWVTAGTHYIGIIQSSINEIGIGVDHNTDSHDKMFLNFNNQWVQSTITGSWMMRPIFGKKLTIGVGELSGNASTFEIYPNPVGDKLSVIGYPLTGAAIEVSIFNVLGEKVSGFPATDLSTPVSIDVSTLSNGVYFVHLKDVKNSSFEVKRFVVQH